MERVVLRPKSPIIERREAIRPRGVKTYPGDPREASTALLRARIEALFRSGEVDPRSGLPAYLDRRRWEGG